VLLKLAAFLLLLLCLAGVVWRFPFLWELGIAGLIGGLWWLFFRDPGVPS